MAEKSNVPEPSEQRIRPAAPASSKLLYSLGYIGTSIVDRVMATLVMYFYLPPAGTPGLVRLVPEATFGLVIFIGRALDTLIDPTIGFMSDRCKSRRGRRMPFMLYGGLPLAALLALLFFPPVHGVSILNVFWFGIGISAFFFFFSFYVCPYLGLMPELAHTPEERINLTSSQGIFMLIGVVIGTVVSPLLIKPFGYRGMAVIMAAIAAVSFYLPVIGVDEKKYCVSEPSSLSLTQTILATLKNRPFVIYLAGNLTFWFGFNIITTCLMYYVTVLLNRPAGDVSIYFGISLGVAFVCIPLVNILTRRIGKRDTMILSLLMFMVLLPTIYFFGDPRVPMSANLFSYIVIALAGIPLATLFVVPNAMVADLTDYDEKLTGVRREAIYFGAQGLFQKITLGLSQLLMSLVFKYYGYSAGNSMGIKLTGFMGGFFALLGVIAFLFFPKDLNAHAEMELKKRGI